MEDEVGPRPRNDGPASRVPRDNIPDSEASFRSKNNAQLLDVHTPATLASSYHVTSAVNGNRNGAVLCVAGRVVDIGQITFRKNSLPCKPEYPVVLVTLESHSERVEARLIQVRGSVSDVQPVSAMEPTLLAQVQVRLFNCDAVTLTLTLTWYFVQVVCYEGAAQLFDRGPDGQPPAVRLFDLVVVANPAIQANTARGNSTQHPYALTINNLHNSKMFSMQTGGGDWKLEAIIRQEVSSGSSADVHVIMRVNQFVMYCAVPAPSCLPDEAFASHQTAALHTRSCNGY